MKIQFDLDTIMPMTTWLKNDKNKGIQDLTQIKSILLMPDYQIEYQYYKQFGITFDDAIDFFMNFNKKPLAKPVMEKKKENFMPFYHDLENQVSAVNKILDFNQDDYRFLASLLNDSLANKIDELEVIINLSIGNQDKYFIDRYIVYDFIYLSSFKTKKAFLIDLANDINTIFHE